MSEGNRLADEASPFLRDAADQPVDWHTWGEEAFEEAREEDKPVLLDVGAAWCHWCHVMDHESYEDPEIAEIINDRFVPVKVDRDARPDVDRRYQKAVQALTGQGGWPLTAFLTPDGEVFYGGTYFPPEGKAGRPGFRDVLRQVSDFYREKPEDARDRARSLRESLRDRSTTRPGSLSSNRVDEAVGALVADADLAHGGFGSAPKFPQTGAVDVLVRADDRGHDRAGDAVEATLEGMARGGIRDHLGGGFHRYSTDAEWIVPHFEKMAYDNAEILRNYVHGYQVEDRPLWREVAGETADWILETLGQEEGGFGGSQDADAAPGDDGDYWTWTEEEVEAVLDDDLARLVTLYYGVGEAGASPPENRRSVLHVASDLEALADARDQSVDEVEADLEEARERLLEARRKRPRPEVDGTRYADWNGMICAALLEAGAALDRPDLTEAALDALEVLDEALWDPDEGYAHSLARGQVGVRGLLEDHVHMGRAHLEAWQVTGEAKHRDRAVAVADLLLEHFWDDEAECLVDLAPGLREDPDPGPLDEPERPALDSPTPGPNPLAALLLDRLERATGEDRYREAATSILEAFADLAREAGAAAGTYHLALLEHLEGGPTVTLAGEGDLDALREAALDPYAPGRVVVEAARDPVPEAAEAPLEGWEGGAAAFVCVEDRCLPPAETPEEVRDRVRQVAAGEA